MRPDRPMLAPVLALAALALALPATAAIKPPPPAMVAPAPPSDNEIGATLRSALAQAQSGSCAAALAALDPLLARVTAPDARRSVQLVRVTCLGETGRIADLKAAYDELVASDPDSPVIRNLGVLIAADMGDYTLAGQRLADFAERRPHDLALLTGENWRGISQGLIANGQRDLRGRVSIALTRAGWQPMDRPEIAQAIASDAIEALITQAQLPEARAMLARVSAPELLFAMAIDRGYEPLWPDVQTAIGPASRTAVDVFAADKIEDNARNPADPLALRDAVRAYLLLGRADDAVALAAQVPVVEGMSEEAVTVVRYHAQALAYEGKSDLAIARLKPLVALDLAKTPVAAAGAVTLVELYHDASQPENELALARNMLGRQDQVFSAWGRGWLKRSEVCALTSLRRAQEAKAAGDSLLAAAKDNEAATVEGLLCAGRLDDAAKVAVATLAKPDGADIIADQFQPTGALWAVPPSKLRDMWGSFLQRTDVKAAFEKVARILPKALWPSRTPRPIPRAPRTAPGTDSV